jgi:hypothetical protein
LAAPLERGGLPAGMGIGERRGASLATRKGDGIAFGGGGALSPTLTMPFGVTFASGSGAAAARAVTGAAGAAAAGAGVGRCASGGGSGGAGTVDGGDVRTGGTSVAAATAPEGVDGGGGVEPSECGRSERGGDEPARGLEGGPEPGAHSTGSAFELSSSPSK